MLNGILQSAISGVNASVQKVTAASGNIANVSTTSYKRTDIANHTLATRQTGTAYASGGVLTSPRLQADVQGLLGASTSPTDMAISGNGYFPVSRTATQGSGALYSRDGSFAPDAQGNLVNASGYYLLARPANDSQDLSPVNVQRIGGTAQASTHLSVGANLPATASVGDVHTVSAQATDSLGNSHTVQLHFTAQTNGAFQLTIPGAQQGSTAGSAYDVSVQFDATGAMVSTPPAVAIASPSSGAADLSMTLDLSGMTRLGGDFTLHSLHSDGARFGTVSSVSVSPQGTLSATFSNGETRAVADIAVATFVNPQGLEALGGNTYRATDASGAPLYDGAGAGQIQGGALELSNTDLATEFANLIVAHTSYSASLKVLSAGEDMARSLMDVRT